MTVSNRLDPLRSGRKLGLVQRSPRVRSHNYTRSYYYPPITLCHSHPRLFFTTSPSSASPVVRSLVPSPIYARGDRLQYAPRRREVWNTASLVGGAQECSHPIRAPPPGRCTHLISDRYVYLITAHSGHVRCVRVCACA